MADQTKKELLPFRQSLKFYIDSMINDPALTRIQNLSIRIRKKSKSVIVLKFRFCVEDRAVGRLAKLSKNIRYFEKEIEVNKKAIEERPHTISDELTTLAMEELKHHLKSIGEGFGE